MTTTKKSPYLGVIEGFFGRSWTFQERYDYADFLKKVAYCFYIYAPKSDPFLRKSWQKNWSTETEKELQSLVKHYHSQGLDFGVGLSPFEIYRNYDESAQKKLAEKVGRLNELDVDILCLLFDDMRGDLPALAKTQIQITKDVLAKTTAKKVIMCPTYYSFDPVLGKVFGTMPEDYLEDLGSGLPSEVDIFWTGEKVCSDKYPDNHLKKVQQLLKRKPFLWDNYPVNDGAKMSKYLHLKAFENRSNTLDELTSGHAVNPMNQPYLSRIPLQTLSDSYAQGIHYQADQALDKSLKSNCGDALAKQLKNDIDNFQEKGLDNFELDQLIKKYADLESPYATEILAWLKGEYAFDPECLTD
ncbi:MAG: beta-N-acetylglucosaminidase domain-containing protein [Cocleimonas sp.]